MRANHIYGIIFLIFLLSGVSKSFPRYCLPPETVSEDGFLYLPKEAGIPTGERTDECPIHSPTGGRRHSFQRLKGNLDRPEREGGGRKVAAGMVRHRQLKISLTYRENGLSIRICPLRPDEKLELPFPLPAFRTGIKEGYRAPFPFDQGKEEGERSGGDHGGEEEAVSV